MEELPTLIGRAREVSRQNFGRRVRFYVPGFMPYSNSYHRGQQAFPSISITGGTCGLGCKHCGGRLLRTMIPATTPQALIEVCRALSAKACVGCLISGGCLQDGSVPIEPFIPAFSQIKRELGLILAVHTGIISRGTAEKLAESGVDVALIDVIGSDETIEEVYGLRSSVKDYEASLEALRASGMAFVPHIVVGLQYGKVVGELEALRIVSRHSPSGVVIIALTPLRETQMEGVKPPEPTDIVRVLAEARLLMPQTPIALGCMRPKGKHRVYVETLAIDAGVNAVAFPEEDAVRYANAIGLETSFSSECCAMMFRDLWPAH